MHFNLPSYEESEAKWHTLWGWLSYWPTQLRRRVIFRLFKWMCLIALAPEFGITIAADEVDSPGFCMTHAFYALMGGFVITVPAEDKGETHPQGSTEAKGQTATMESGQVLQLSEPPQKLEYFSINSSSLSILFTRLPAEGKERWKVLCSFLALPRRNIKNQAKSDPLTKAFAVLQCTWLIVQSISRTSQGLLLTELELTTLAFTICAVIMYGFWWCKPFDAQRPIRLLCSDPQAVSQVHSSLQPWGIGSRILSTNVSDVYILVLARSAMFHTSAVAFSFIHLIAWNWDFPSPVIRILWRSFSLGAKCLPLVAVAGLAPIFFLVYKFAKSDGEAFVAAIAPIVFAAMGLIYCAYRLSLIVLIFYCFSALPASVYETPSWHTVFPHFS
ncbi:hypothetical protein BJX62DRAFT_222473 [Aspergillus germanicus]